jgi:hypothetical protein
MNYIEVELFYGLGLCIQAITGVTVITYEETPEGLMEVEAEFNGLILVILCFRFMLGNTGDP